MDSQLNTDFDVIVLGTGFIESLVASACARIGKKVLHLDQNEYYGDSWASLSLINIQKWVDEVNNVRLKSEVKTCDINLENESFLDLSQTVSTFFNASYHWEIPVQCDSNTPQPDVKPTASVDVKPPDGLLQSDESLKSENTSQICEDSRLPTTAETSRIPSVISRESLENENRKFNIDLSPKVIYSRGPMVELFISSNTSKYLEFKCISRILVSGADTQETTSQRMNGLIPVPCSRSDVFTSDAISLIEKRILMKFLDFCSSYDLKQEEWQEFSDGPLIDLLRARKLSPKVARFVSSAMASANELVNCSEGLKCIKLFLISLGRYGRLPYLFPLFGAGEIPQAFCRLSAVFEGIYMLHRQIDGIVISETKNDDGVLQKKAVGVSCEGQKFMTKNVVSFYGYVHELVRQKVPKKKSLSRAVFVTDRSISCDGQTNENCSVIHFPGSDTNNTNITAIELCSSAAVCPAGTYLVYLVCRGEDAKSDFQEIRQCYFSSPEVLIDKKDSYDEDDSLKPTILFSLYFNQVIYDLQSDSNLCSMPNVFLCSGPDETQDYETAINEAKLIFHEMFPGEDFLPRAPDPNELIFE